MIFLSYNHAQSSAADKLEAYLKENLVQVLRDTQEMKKNDSISDFMSRISSSDYAILLISDAYLRSYYCLHEALLAFKNRHRRNIIPVIFPDAHCLTPGSSSEYIRYWYDQMQELEHSVDGLPPQLAVEQLKKLRQVENYCINLGELLEYIQDNNSICFDNDHWLEETFQCLCERILNREIRSDRFPPTSFDLSSIGNDPLLSIDFGTSYTLASVLDRNGSTHLIPDCTGNPLHHSTVTFTDSGHYRVGTNAHDAIRNIKRLIGSRNSVLISGEEFSLPLLIAMILKSIIRDAEAYLDRSISHVLMSLPVDFSITEKHILSRSAELAGVQVKRFVPESSTESLLLDPYYDDKDETAHVAFIDLGGGTLDISLAECGDGIYEILYTSGDKEFGSIDLTERLAQLIKKKLTAQYGIQAGDVTALAELSKRQLGTADSIAITYPHFTSEGNVDHLELVITTAEFETEAIDLFEKFDRQLTNLKSVIQIYGDDLDQLFLTGQGTKLQLLRRHIEAAFPEIPIVDTYQENAVIRGLSVEGGILGGMLKDILLLDAFTGELYIDYGQKIMFLESNTTIPTYRRTSLELTEEQYGKTISIEVFERTASLTTHRLFQTQFVPLSEKKYEVWFDIDSNWTGSIMLLELSDEKDAIHIHYPYAGLNTGLKTDRYTVLYRYDF